jgi:hypothetical protein
LIGISNIELQIDSYRKIPPFINIFVDGDDIRSLELEQTRVNENSIRSRIPAIAVGSDYKL